MQFLIEAVSICLLGGVIGVALAVAAKSAIASAAPDFPFTFSADLIVLACALSILTGIFSGLAGLQARSCNRPAARIAGHPHHNAMKLPVSDLFDLSTKSLGTNKLRSMLTMLGIAIGVFSVVGVMTALSAIRQSIDRGLSILAANCSAAASTTSW